MSRAELKEFKPIAMRACKMGDLSAQNSNSCAGGGGFSEGGEQNAVRRCQQAL